jgi:hypothetical protein
MGLALTVTSITFLLLLGEGLYTRLGVVLSPKGTFGIDWLFFGYLLISLLLIVIVGIVSVPYLVSSMINQRMRDIAVIKAAGTLPRRLFSYAFTEVLLIVGFKRLNRRDCGTHNLSGVVLAFTELVQPSRISRKRR